VHNLFVVSHFLLFEAKVSISWVIQCTHTNTINKMTYTWTRAEWRHGHIESCPVTSFPLSPQSFGSVQTAPDGHRMNTCTVTSRTRWCHVTSFPLSPASRKRPALPRRASEWELYTSGRGTARFGSTCARGDGGSRGRPRGSSWEPWAPWTAAGRLGTRSWWGRVDPRPCSGAPSLCAFGASTSAMLSVISRWFKKK